MTKYIVNNILTGRSDVWVSIEFNSHMDKWLVIEHNPTPAQEDDVIFEFDRNKGHKARAEFKLQVKYLQNIYHF